MELFELFQETADLVSHQLNQAVIRLPQPLELGQECTIRLMIRGREVSYRVRVDWLKPAEPDWFTCGCTLLEPDHISEDGPERRRSKRTLARFRVTSPDLPGESATTIDLSLTGMLLKTQGPMEIGESLLLAVESSGPVDFTVRARVCWCRDLDNDYLVGVTFHPIDDPIRRRLEAFCDGEAVDLT